MLRREKRTGENDYVLCAVGAAMGTLVALAQLHPVAVAAVGAGMLVLLGFVLAYQRTLQVQAAEQVALARDLTNLTALAAAAPRAVPVTALITGANSGIGFTLATLLARCGLRVVLGCRSPARGQAAVDRIRAAVGPAADVRLLIVDVSSPDSVLSAAARCRAADGALGVSHGLSFLFLNAGVMPLSRYRWEVAAHAFFTGGLGHFLTTGRSHPGGAHFLGQPQDECGAAGAPATFATNVLGHLLLVEELLPLLQRGGGTGRVVWTGSRAATRHLFHWGHLQPPAAPGAPSGHQAWLGSGKGVLGEAYGESKFATDLLNPALCRRIHPVPSAVVCPGFIDTEITPPFFKAFIPFIRLIRGVTEGFNILPELGAHVSIAAALALGPGSGELRPDRKYVLRAGQLVPAGRGAPATTKEDQDRMLQLCNAWMDVWRASAKGAHR